MNRRYRTYTGYSVGCFVVWGAILGVTAPQRGTNVTTIRLVCAGWVIGWLSATIARAIYPPPRRTLLARSS